MFPATRNEGGTRLCQSSASASPSMIRTLENLVCSEGTRSGSFSIATTCPARLASAPVRPPGPGPISRTVSLGPAPSASAIRARILGSARKCCPRRRLARGTLDPHDQESAVVDRSHPERIGVLENRLHDGFG